MSYSAIFVQNLLDHYFTSDFDQVNNDADLLFDAVNYEDYDSIVSTLQEYSYTRYLQDANFRDYFTSVIETAKIQDPGDSYIYHQLFALTTSTNVDVDYRTLLQEYYDQEIMDRMDEFAQNEGDTVYQDAYNQIVLYTQNENQTNRVRLMFDALRNDNNYAFVYYFDRLADTLSVPNLNELYYIESDKTSRNQDILNWLILSGAQPVDYGTVLSNQRGTNFSNFQYDDE